MLLPTTSQRGGRCGCLAGWKPLEGWTLCMVYTYAVHILSVGIFLGGCLHCRAYRMYTTVECGTGAFDGCNVQKQYGGSVELDINVSRSSLVEILGVRMLEGELRDTKGMKKREIGRLDYGAQLKYKEEVGMPQFPSRGCVSWRQTANCDPEGGRESEFDRNCMDLVPGGASGYCECDGDDRAGKSKCDHGVFTCDEICRGATYDNQFLTLTTYDMGRREQKRGVDKVTKYINNRGVNTASISAGFGWTWGGFGIITLAIFVSIMACCVGEMWLDEKDHKY